MTIVNQISCPHNAQATHIDSERLFISLSLSHFDKMRSKSGNDVKRMKEMETWKNEQSTHGNSFHDGFGCLSWWHQIWATSLQIIYSALVGSCVFYFPKEEAFSFRQWWWWLSGAFRFSVCKLNFLTERANFCRDRQWQKASTKTKRKKGEHFLCWVWVWVPP